MNLSCAGLKRRTVLAALALAPGWAVAEGTIVPPEVLAELPGARLQGNGRLTFMALPVYQARLWVAEGFAPARFADSPLALELIYARSLDGKRIAERSLDEMKRAGNVDVAQGTRWLTLMTGLIPDVKEGDRVTGVHRPGQSVAFFANGKPLGDVRDAEFGRRFFGIWLAPSTSEPRLRQQLLGPSQGAG